MKKLKSLIRNMTLTQQLMMVVMVSLSVFIFIVMVFIFGNINSLVKEQLLNSIQRDQTLVIQNYEYNVTDVFNGTDPNIIHIIYFMDDSSTSLTNSTTTLNTSLDIEFKGRILNMSSPSLDYETSVTGKEILYTITQINTQAVLVSFVIKSTMDQFKLALINGVVNILLIIVGVLFLLLMLWVGYLIHSLKQIETYIDLYRKGENPELKMDRHDEVGELAQAIVSMNQEIKRQEQLKEEMVQNISHDLKTPIATIKSYGESIKDGIYPYETLEKSVDVIIEHATRLEKKVHSLLLLNRMGYLVSEDHGNQRTDMKQVVEKVILSLKVFKPRIRLKTNLTSCSYNGSEEPWRVVVENLLDNALRYAKTEIIIDLDQAGLRVYNDGIAIPQDRVEQLFNPYEKGTGGQFGLGLAIVKRVVSAYHYTIRVENLDKGVQFIIEEKPVYQKPTKEEYL